MSGNQNGGGGGCIVLTMGEVKHKHAIVSSADGLPRPIRFEFDPPPTQKSPGTNGGGGGCIRLKIGGTEHQISYKPSDEIELQFDFSPP